MFKPSFSVATLIVIGLLHGCASVITATNEEPLEAERNERSTGAYIDDEIIETKALVNIDKAHPELAESHIVVVSYNGVVLLTGQVAREDLRQIAAETVAKINRVQRVHNELMLAPPTSMVVRSNDAWITTKVKTKLFAKGNIEGGRIKVVTENGVVFLMGLVSRDEADLASEVARKTAGVQKVVRIFEYTQS